MRRALPILLLAFSLRGATYYVTIAGLGGEAEYEQRFTAWARDLDKMLKAAPEARVETLYGPASNKTHVRETLEKIARSAGPQDALVLMLIGHGTFDGIDYKFNLPGWDLSSAELGTLLERVRAGRQLVVNMTSASGACLDLLKQPHRVVVTATKAGSEKNATIFARYWVEALRDPSADTDKNEVVSALEAFRYAEQKTAKFYESQKRLATEHPRLEGSEAASFPVVRFGSAATAFSDPAKRALLGRREQLEQQIDALKLQKAGMPADEYKSALTKLLLELAKTQAELDK